MQWYGRFGRSRAILKTKLDMCIASRGAERFRESGCIERASGEG
jgi:hypothetical protein